MVVLDCNALVNMAAGTQEGQALQALLLEGELALAPTLAFAELTHVLEKHVRYGYLSSDEAHEMGESCLALIDRFVDDGELWQEALAESINLEHSSYYLFYLVLARRNAATLVTLDRKLQKLCLSIGVNCTYLDTDF